MERNYTVQDLRDYREQNSCGLAEARRRLDEIFFLDTVDKAQKDKDFDLLCEVVRELILEMRTR